MHGAGDEDLAGPGAAGNPRADVNRDARDFSSTISTLSGVHPGADLEAEPAHGVDEAWAQRIARAGPSKRREEPVARRVDLAPAEALELASNRGVVSLQQLPPAPVAELGRPLR